MHLFSDVGHSTHSCRLTCIANSSSPFHPHFIISFPWGCILISQKKKIFLCSSNFFCLNLTQLNILTILHVSSAVVQAEPLMAPSYAQAAQRRRRDDPAALKDMFMSSVMELLRNKGYVLLLVSYGINVGAFFAISTLLNQFILLYFPVSANHRPSYNKHAK